MSHAHDKCQQAGRLEHRIGAQEIPAVAGITPHIAITLRHTVILLGAPGGRYTATDCDVPTERRARSAEDTIITWTDPELQTDIALSFQEAAGCNHVWEQIQDVHQRGDAGRRRGAFCSQLRPCCGRCLNCRA